MNDSFQQLCSEIKKYTSFREQEDVKSACNESIQAVNQKQVSFPISNSNSPFVKAISAILRSKKSSTSLYPLIRAICDCISQDIFTDSALSSIVREFDHLHNYDDIEFSLKIIQFMSSTLPKHLSHLNLIKSLCSIVLNFLTDSHAIVVNASYAAIQQMISTEFNFIQNSKFDELSPEDRSKMKIIVKNGLSAKFNDPLCVIAFLILNDLAFLLSGKNSMWLHINSIPTTTLMKLWEAILLTQTNFLKSSHHFLKIVENSVNSLQISEETVSLHASFCKMFYFELPDSSISLISRYLSHLTKESENNSLSLIFFKSILLADSTFFATFSNTEIVSQLFTNLDKYIDPDAYKTVVDVSLTQIIDNSKNPKFYLIVPCEISLLLINQVIPNANLDINQYINHLISILIKLIRICDKNSCEIVFRSCNLLILNIKPENDEYRIMLLRILCSLISKQRIFRNPLDPLEEQANQLLHINKQGFWFKGKSVFSYHLISKLLQTHPEFFLKIFNRLFGCLSFYEDANIDPAFTKQLSQIEIINLSKILVSGSSFSINFLAKMLPQNVFCFTQIWETIYSSIPPLFEKDELCEAATNLLGVVSSKMVTKETEQEILQCYSTILNFEGKPSVDTRCKLIEQINLIIKHFGTIIDNGWKHIISAIKLQNCSQNKVIIGIAFQTLNSICTDNLQKLSDPLLSNIINLIIDYTSKNPDLNIALTAIGLLWNVAPQITKSVTLWKQVLSLMLPLFNDPRADVSSGALSTFFTLLTSNSQQMPAEIFPHLLDNCLIKLLESYVTFPAEKYIVYQHALCEIGHCVCSFWAQLDSLSSFRQKFWPLLIEKVLTFLTVCEDSEICSNCLAFYEDVFPCPLMSTDVRELLLSSFEKIVYLFLDRDTMSNFVISEIGKVSQRTLPTQKSVLNDAMLDKWLSIFERLSLTLPSEKIVHSVTQKCISASFGLLPMDDEYMIKICQSMSKIAVKSGKMHVINCVLQNIMSALDSLAPENYKIFVMSMSEIFALPNSVNFLKKVISLADKFNQSDMYRIFSEIADKNAEVSQLAITEMIKSLSSAETEDKLFFVQKYSKDSSVLMEVLKKYCLEDSEEFSQSVFDSCFDQILLGLKFAVEKGNLEVIVFLREAKVPPKTFGFLKDCRRWHLHFLACSFSRLLSDSRPEVSQAASKVVSDIAEDFAAMTKSIE